MGGAGRGWRIALWGEVAVNPTASALSKRARAMLARLSLSPTMTFDRATLAALRWPERTDAQALGNLRQLLHDHGWLMQAPEPLLIVARDRLDLDPTIRTDHSALLGTAAGEPEPLADALEATDPRFLAGLDGLGEDFEAWRSSETRRAVAVV